MLLPVGYRYCPECGRRTAVVDAVPLRRRRWWKLLLAGLAVYWAALRLLAATGNPNLAPTVLLVGAFLVPVVFVVYLYESNALYDVPAGTLTTVFSAAGALGVVAAQLLEQRLLLSLPVAGLLAVGLAEEVAKPLGALWLARGAPTTMRTPRHGLLLGATAGMGFAAFETMGYGFTALTASRGSLDAVTTVLLTRGLLAPLAHAAWTALVVGVFWAEQRRVTPAVLAALAAAAGLHALWNWSAALVPVELVLPGLELRWRLLDLTVPELSLPVAALAVGALSWALVRGVLRRAGERPLSGGPSAAPDRP